MELVTFVENFEKELQKRQIDFLKMDLVHGFLTGICIAPRMIMPSEWFPSLFEDQFEFKNEDDAYFVFSFLSDLYNKILEEFQHENFSPLYVELENEEGGQELFVRDWCRGFIYATVSFYKDEIYQYIEENEDQLRDVLVLHHLAELSEESDSMVQELIADLEKENLDLIDLIPIIVINMYVSFNEKYLAKVLHKDEFDDFSEKAKPAKKSTPKVGRNDPCPCGSGKKYKHCCGKGK